MEIEAKKLSSKGLRERLSKLQKLSSEKSKLAAKEKEIKVELEAHLLAVGTENVAVGEMNVGMNPSTCVVEVTKKGIKKADATRDLVSELLKADLGNLVEQKPKTALLHELQGEKNEKVCAIMKGLGIKITQNKTLKIKRN